MIEGSEKKKSRANGKKKQKKIIRNEVQFHLRKLKQEETIAKID